LNNIKKIPFIFMVIDLNYSKFYSTIRYNNKFVKNSFVFLLLIISLISPHVYGLNTGDFHDSELFNTKQLEDIYDEQNSNAELTTDGMIITKSNGSDGPLGEWPDFTPIGYITAPHPDNPDIQTHLYGDWGGIVGEEFIFLQDDMIKLLYHSYHETYMTERIHEINVLDNWTLGYDPITKIKYTPLVSPGGPIPGPAYEHTDTPGYIQHPLTGEHLIYNTVRPGTKYLHPEWDGLTGWEGAIQVSTSSSPPTIGVPFDQTYNNILVPEYWWEQGWNQNGVIKGGLSEPTPVWDPHLGTNGKIRLFYRGLHGSPSSYWNWRISYADSEDGKTGWIKNPTPTFDPSDPNNPAYQWTLPYPEGFSFRGAWQAHITGDIRADGVHMVLMVSNQNYAGSGHIAYYWSPDWGDTWIGHPDNPIIAPGQFPNGVPASGFQRTPTLLIDEKYNRYILAYNAGHDINQQWKRRTYLATASRPLLEQIPSGWRLISLPINTSMNLSELTVYHDGVYYDWNDAVTTGLVDNFVFGWNNTLQSYEIDTVIKKGKGYWCYSYEDNVNIIVNPSGNNTEIANVDTNWNIVGSPLNEDFAFSDIIVEYLGMDYSWDEAVSNGYISQFVFGWNSETQQYYLADTLNLREAYWLFAYQPCTLKRSI
jgi:hypothetical protein